MTLRGGGGFRVITTFFIFLTFIGGNTSIGNFYPKIVVFDENLMMSSYMLGDNSRIYQPLWVMSLGDNSSHPIIFWERLKFESKYHHPDTHSWFDWNNLIAKDAFVGYTRCIMGETALWKSNKTFFTGTFLLNRGNVSWHMNFFYKFFSERAFKFANDRKIYFPVC